MIHSKLLKKLTLIALAIAPILLATVAQAAEEAQSSAKSQAAVQKVEAKFVCMVNDSLFEREQIAVAVEDRTYYGCCEMCKERLAVDEGIRQAIDPVSGATVDKATATIGAQTDGSVLYFESEENLAKYNEGRSS